MSQTEAPPPPSFSIADYRLKMFLQLSGWSSHISSPKMSVAASSKTRNWHEQTVSVRIMTLHLWNRDSFGWFAPTNLLGKWLGAHFRMPSHHPIVQKKSDVLCISTSQEKLTQSDASVYLVPYEMDTFHYSPTNTERCRFCWTVNRTTGYTHILLYPPIESGVENEFTFGSSISLELCSLM